MEDQPIDNDELQEITAEFITESAELVETAMRDILSLEEDPSSQAINGVFRAVHTLKGTSGFLGFEILSSLAHGMEDVLGKMRKGVLSPNASIIGTLLRSLDEMKLLVEQISAYGRETRGVDRVLAELKAIGEKEGLTPCGATAEQAVDGQAALRVNERAIPKAPGPVVSEALSATPPGKEETVRVGVRKLDELMNLAGELVLGKNRLALLNALVKDSGVPHPALDSLAEVTNYIEMIANDLQTAVMRARLVPINRLFNKVPRLVRDLCSASGKEVGLVIEGGETELDKSLIEILRDPLTHIIRNSIDHGIETPRVRMNRGKAAKGLITLRARGEGNRVVIEVVDDGKGLDVNAIKEQVVERGLMSSGEVEKITAEEATNFIFVPGFSTAKRLTSVSGRGVGMDVVKTNVERVSGRVYVDSQEGKFTRLTITLPLTLASMKALLVRVSNELYAIPLNVVLEVIKPTNELVKTVQGQEVLVLRDLIVPVVKLSTVVSSGSEGDEECSVVLCRTPDRPVGLKVDAVLGQEEVVIKSLGELLKTVRWIAGATIRGDGRIVLILDIPEIVANSLRHRFAA